MPPWLWLAALLCASCGGRASPASDGPVSNESIEERDRRVWCEWRARCAGESVSACIEQEGDWRRRIICRRTDQEILDCLARIEARTCAIPVGSDSWETCLPLHKSVDGCVD